MSKLLRQIQPSFLASSSGRYYFLLWFAKVQTRYTFLNFFKFCMFTSKNCQKGSSFLQCRRQWKLTSWWTLCHWEQRSRLTNNPAQSQFSTFWIMKSREILDTVIDQQTLHIVVKPTNLNIQGKGHYCWRQNNFIEATLWFLSQFQCGRKYFNYFNGLCIMSINLATCMKRKQRTWDFFWKRVFMDYNV